MTTHKARRYGGWLAVLPPRELVRMNLAPTKPVVQEASCEKSNSRCSRLDRSNLRQSSNVSSAAQKKPCLLHARRTLQEPSWHVARNIGNCLGSIKLPSPHAQCSATEVLRRLTAGMCVLCDGATALHFGIVSTGAVWAARMWLAAPFDSLGPCGKWPITRPRHSEMGAAD